MLCFTFSPQDFGFSFHFVPFFLLQGDLKRAYQFQAQANSIWERAYNGGGSRRRIYSEDTPRSQWKRSGEATLRNCFVPIEGEILNSFAVTVL